MRPSDLHTLIRNEMRGTTSNDAASAADTEVGLSSAVRVAFATWRDRVRAASGDLQQLVAPAGSLDWMAPVMPAEPQPSNA